jgi:hypothetical protein
MFVYYLLNNGSPVKYQSIHVFWLNTSELNHLVKHHLGWPNILTFRKYKALSMTGDMKKDSLEFYKLEVLSKELAIKKDTVNGLNISFGPNSTYGELMDVLNKRDNPGNKQLIFQFINNRILVFYVPLIPVDKSAKHSAYDI